MRRSPAPELFTRFLARTTAWEGVSARGISRKHAPEGAPLDYSRYLRLRKEGSRLGGFAYVYAERSSINLRLHHSMAELRELGVTSARVLSTGHPKYRVSVDLTDETSLEDALTLAEAAYRAT
ncbi:hypothetical protein ACTWJ8_40555 (plasmid) [Streptomyces sp. SDT5-1]|uniref:hypothetical protein n=1 Tax=Streptomyces sp. SDT5-1 TaxID=3406418 RepID=UPI003FD28052